MKNPLYRRIPRELKKNLGKYIAMFLFLLLTIGFCSGYFIATGSLAERLEKNYDTFKTVDGHFTMSKAIDNSTAAEVEKNGAELYELFYKDKTLENDHVVRVYDLKDRQKINIPEMYSGKLPSADNEIVIDRLYARNNDYEIGDSITIENKKLKITGFFVVPDYTSLYKNNTDLMFDALDFSIALVSDKCFEELGESGLKYNYAWMYQDRTLDEQQKHDKAEKLCNAIADQIDLKTEEIKQNIATAVLKGELSLEEVNITEDDLPAMLTDFIPGESNFAINMATEDVGGDKIMVMWLLYITIAVIALATAITTKSTVEQEAGVIGTLRASGYNKSELVGHYLIIPILSAFLAALGGNVIGYTYMNSFCASMYYGSYSFPVYQPNLNAEAFLMTTLIPVGIVILINFLTLSRLISLPPLQFLRRELKKNKRSKSIKLPFGSFSSRFRTRVILRNYQAYIVLAIGILFANILLVFSLIWNPLLDNFRDTILDNQISDYQYMLKAPAETNEKSAEKFAAYQLKNPNDEDITIYGIENDSKYLKNTDFSNGRVYYSSAYLDKYGLNTGDSVTFSEKFSSKKYELKVDDVYDYPGSLCVFMGIDDFRKTFDLESDEYSGYFSNEKINDIDDVYIATVIGISDLTSTADQLENSVGFVKLFSFFAIAVYILMIYILSKMITERNAKSISVLKILGYKDGEISNLYNFSTGVVVLISMFISLPLISWLIRILYYAMMLEYNGWLSFYLDPMIYPQVIAIGCLCFLVAYLLEMRRVRKIAMNEAIKDME